MKKRRKNTVASAALLLLAATLLHLAAGEFVVEITGEARRHLVPALYVLGDSLVDVGNNNFLPPPAPRADFPCGIDLPHEIAGRRTGRFTNGFNLADIIAQHVGFNMSPPAYLSSPPQARLDLMDGQVGANYASGGSGILDSTGNGTITLREQIQLFADTKSSTGESGRRRLLSRSLFLISTGGNDFDAFSDGRATVSEAPAFIATMVSTYVSHIKALYKLGARRVGLLDALPIGCLPCTRFSDGACDATANSLAERFNSLLRAEMARAVAASMPTMKYSVASIYNIFSDMIANPGLAGLEEVESGCCGGGRLNAEVGCSASSNLCADRSEYVFWDKVHGTQAAYQRAVIAIFDGPTTKYAEPVSFKQLIQSAVVDLESSYAIRASEI